VRSNQRPGTSSSFITSALPTWAKFYYTVAEDAGNSTLALVEESSRPAPARPPTSNSSYIQRIASVVTRARTSTNASRGSVKQQPMADLRDPRSHWAKDSEVSVSRTTSTLHRLRHSWSPHLFPDRRVVAPKTSIWRAPSLDSRTEPIYGRRNIQVWSFCLGFICPLSTHHLFQ
jgi:hypothetical protein